MTSPAHHYTKIYLYALLGASVIGAAISLTGDLNRVLFLPFFPNILDAALMICVGGVLLYEVFKEALR